MLITFEGHSIGKAFMAAKTNKQLLSYTIYNSEFLSGIWLLWKFLWNLKSFELFAL